MRGIIFLTVLVISTQAWSATKKSGVIKPEVVPGQFLVKLKPQFRALNDQSIERAIGAEVKGQITDSSKWIAVRRPTVETTAYALSAMKQSSIVEKVEPNYIYRPVNIPNDPELQNLWGLRNTGQTIIVKNDEGEESYLGRAGVDIGMEKAWDIQTGSKNIVVAVIDTGIDYKNENLVDNLWVNEAEKNGVAGLDDDNNGYVDDIYGYNFAADKPHGDPMDDHGHGTHCSGTIGASGNDGKGIVGVNWNVRIMGVKFLGPDGGTTEGAIEAIDYARKNGADIMSNSWGGGGPSDALKEAIQRANDAGILFLAAAGNNGTNNDEMEFYPANYDVPNLISVAALDNSGQLADFSCYGPTKVHIAAPGVAVLSSILDGKMDYWSGTSMATPHVSGVAALVLANEPDLTVAQLRERLLSTAQPLFSLKGMMTTGGMVNAYYALKNEHAPADPNDPTNWPKKEHTISTEHPYKSNATGEWTITVPGAKQISVHFSKFETESGFDYVTLIDGQGKIVGKISGTKKDYYTMPIAGDTVTLKFKADDSVDAYGFDVDFVNYQ